MKKSEVEELLDALEEGILNIVRGWVGEIEEDLEAKAEEFKAAREDLDSDDEDIWAEIKEINSRLDSDFDCSGEAEAEVKAAREELEDKIEEQQVKISDLGDEIEGLKDELKALRDQLLL